MANQGTTQYGLKNGLKVSGYIEQSKNLYKFELSKNSVNEFQLYLLFLSPNTLRFHYSKNDFNLEINPELEFENFSFKQKSFIQDFQEEKDFYYLSSESLVIKIYKSPFYISVSDKKGKIICQDEPELGFWTDGKELRSYKQYFDIENPPIIYGLGDKTGALNRWGKRFRNEPIDALGYDSEHTDPLYKDIPFFINLDSKTKKAHGIFFDNFHQKFFDFGKERKPSLYYHFGAKGGELNYYIFAQDSIEDILREYLNLTGFPALMPEFAFGYLASGMSYTENYSKPKAADQELLETFRKFKDKNIPASAFHLSSGYIENKDGKRMQFIWNTEKFPEVKKFSKDAKELGVELCVNLKPVLLIEHPFYKEADSKSYFIKNKSDTSLVSDYWGGKGSFIDFSNPKAQQWWRSKFSESFLDNDIHGIWNDNNEYEVFEESNIDDKKALMPNLMTKVSYDLVKEKIAQPWILSRSGYAGIQKYAQTWTGDNYSSFKALKFDTAILSNMSISGIVHSGCDIGGFWGKTPDPELLLRWIQVGVFSPRFCIHSYKEIPTEADMYADSHKKFFEITQKFMALRTKLMPYILQANKDAHEKGIPIQRPTVFDFQHDTDTYEQSFEYLFCKGFLVAPIYKAGAQVQRKIYLPKFTDSNQSTTWVDLWTQENYKGGQEITLDVDHSFIPVFFRSDMGIEFLA